MYLVHTNRQIKLKERVKTLSVAISDKNEWGFLGFEKIGRVFKDLIRHGVFTIRHPHSKNHKIFFSSFVQVQIINKLIMAKPISKKRLKPTTKIGSYVDNMNKVSDESSQLMGGMKSYGSGGSMKSRYKSGGIIQYD